jgi:hypothetical protein
MVGSPTDQVTCPMYSILYLALQAGLDVDLRYPAISNNLHHRFISPWVPRACRYRSCVLYACAIDRVERFTERLEGVSETSVVVFAFIVEVSSSMCTADMEYN